jgi:hypothetical protein
MGWRIMPNGWKPKSNLPFAKFRNGMAMKKQNLLLFLVMTSLIFGCAAPESPTQLPTESPAVGLPTLTSTPKPPSTANATETKKPATPTASRQPRLQTGGPYLAYFQEVRGLRRLVFMNADGSGRKVMELPKPINNSLAPKKPFDLDVRLVSPDGQWLAFYTGSAGTYGALPAAGASDLTLHLLDLATGEERVITSLLSKDYPNNFGEAAQKLNDPDITAQSLHDAFITGITEAVAWSPDGLYLAFAGQMDGLSSDLYVYDMTEGRIRRLSSGDQEVQWIEWSPDGKWILHSSVFFVGVGMTYDIYAASLDSSSVPYLSTNIQDDGIKNWLNSHQYFENDGENVTGLYGLRLVDIDTGKIIKLWDETFYSYAVDKSGNWVAILDSPDAPSSENGFEFESDFVPGIYLINLTTLEQSRVEFPDVTHEYGDLQPFGSGEREFVLIERTTRNPVFLSKDGNLTQTDLGDGKIYVSPNLDYWIAVTNDIVKLFSADNTLVKRSEIPLRNSFISDVIWRPDSSGLFLISDAKILSMNVPSGDIKIVESSLISDNYNQAFGWINSE